MLNWQFALLQKLLDNWKAATETRYQPTEEELAALDWFMTMSELGEHDRLWLVQTASAAGMEVETLLELSILGQTLELDQ